MPAERDYACAAPEPIRCRLLITGHPRSGTGYMAALCNAMGLDVGHEKIGDYGISSWLMGPPVWRVCFHRYWQSRGRMWYEFDKVVEVVRDPLPHIASVAFTESAGGPNQIISLNWRAMWVPLNLGEDADPVEQAVQSIVGWHSMIKLWLPGAVTVRRKDARRRLPEILGVAEAESDPGVVNSRPHEKLTWKQVRSRCSDPVWSALLGYAKEIGYDHPPA